MVTLGTPAPVEYAVPPWNPGGALGTDRCSFCLRFPEHWDYPEILACPERRETCPKFGPPVTTNSVGGVKVEPEPGVHRGERLARDDRVHGGYDQFNDDPDAFTAWVSALFSPLSELRQTTTAIADDAVVPDRDLAPAHSSAVPI